ncbi:choice-of-anchor D domain-containing protein [Bacteroidota bacterium]
MKKFINFLLTFLFLLPVSILSQQKSIWDDIPEDIKQTKPYKRFEWFYKQRAFPYDTIPQYRFLETVEREKEKIKSRFGKISSLPEWTSVGPNGIQPPNYLSHWGIVSGRVRALAIHPTDPLIVYIGAACGGIWKTTDGGESWMKIGEELESLSFGAIDIDPANPEIIYAGSGEVGFFTGSIHFTGRGLFKSTDGGQSWDQITNGFGINTHFGDVAVSPHNPNIIIAALASGAHYIGKNLPNEGIWKSSDSGINWVRTKEVWDAYDIVFCPTDTNLVYAAVGGMNNSSGFYISDDKGDTWTQSDTGLQAANTIARMQIDISQSNPNIIYAVTYQTGSGIINGTTRAFKSVDGGHSWGQISAGVNLGGYWNGWVDQGFYDLCIAVNPLDSNNVFIGNIELHETTNGADFVPRRIAGGTNANHSIAHCDYHKLVFSKSQPSYFYIGCDGGVYKSTDAGATVNSINEGLRTLQFYRISSDHFNPEILIGGTQDNFTSMTFNYGQTWGAVVDGDGMECIFDYSDPDIVYASVQNGKIFKSIDGGTNFNVKYNANGAWITPYLLHPTNPDTIYVANKNIHRSINGGLTFPVLAPLNEPVSISAMAQSSANPNNMIFATGGGDWPMPDSIFIVKISTNGGENWQEVTTNIPGESRWISRVETDPLDANAMYVLRTGFSENNKFYKTTDLGQSWSNISGNLPDIPYSDVFIYPFSPDTIFVASDIGVYMTINGGNNWIYASEQIPLVPCFDFDFVSIDSTGYLRVGTHGQSIWETIIFPPAPTIAINPTDLDFGEVLINNDSTMIFTIMNSGNASLEINNILSSEPAFTVNITGDTLAPGNDMDVGVTFTPTEEKQYNGIIEIVHNALGSPDSVTVTGSGIITGIEDELLNTIPTEFVVYQNFPNPFNPKTSIIFGLPEASKVKLTLFNFLGEEVTSLFEGYKNAGYHQVEFDATNLPSGIYFYQLQADEFVQTKKMILMK